MNLQVPYGVSEGPATLVLTVGEKSSNVASFRIASAAPGIIYGLPGRAAALNQDTSLNTLDRPARAGSIMTLFMTGQGTVDRVIADGAAAPSSPLARAIWPVSATIGGLDAPVIFAGLAPGFIGLLQVNLQVPDLPNGDARVVVTIKDAASNSALVAVAAK